MKIVILLLCCTALVWSCNKHDGVDPTPTPTPLKADLTASKTTIVYDGVSSDSTVVFNWSITGATGAAFNNDSVGTFGTKTVTLFNNANFELKAWNDKATTTASKAVTVTIDPQLALLCGGWFQMVRSQRQDPTTKVWYDKEIVDTTRDDLIKFAPNRTLYSDFGEIRYSFQRRYGSTDTAFTLTGAQKNILHLANIDWKITTLTSTNLVLEGYVPGLWGSPDEYSRQTYIRSN